MSRSRTHSDVINICPSATAGPLISMELYCIAISLPHNALVCLKCKFMITYTAFRALAMQRFIIWNQNQVQVTAAGLLFERG